jgi:hypothetical protein
MKRLIAIAAVLSVAGSAPVLAAGGPGAPTAAPPPAGTSVAVKPDFSARAAGIDRLAASHAAPAARRGAPPAAPAPRSMGSFVRSPWPYVIGGAAIGIYFLARSGGSAY